VDIPGNLAVNPDLAGADITLDSGVLFQGQPAGSADVTLEQNARVEGDVSARQIRINGQITGNVHAGESLTCGVTAIIDGDLHTADLSVENGASIRGTVVAGSHGGRATGEDADEE
jgi:cytoskeletal protein CcmA (bactofilin family)